MSSWEAAAGATNEWYTPKFIFDALGERFDVDVAAPPGDYETHVPADLFIREDSLRRAWRGFIWMNPPFGGRNGLVPWLDKFCEHGDGVALTPDRTSAPWFQKYAPRVSLMLFLPKVCFERPDGTRGKQPSSGTTLWAVGARAETALHRAARVGLGFRSIPLGLETGRPVVTAAICEEVLRGE